MSRTKIKTAKKLLSIITVTFNNQAEISNFLNSLHAQNLWQRGYSAEIILIDNGSKDETFSIVKRCFQELSSLKRSIVIQNLENVGFAKAVNQGIRESRGRFVLLMNPDLVLLKKNSLQELVKCLHDKEVDIVGGLLLKSKTLDVPLTSKVVHGTFVRRPGFLTGIFEFTNIKKLWPQNPFYKHFYYLNEKDPFKSKLVEAVSGAFMLFRKELINKIGFFDENFFLYLEDIDFCLRARSVKLKIFFCNAAIAYHYSGASSKYERRRINYDAWKHSRRYFFKKHLSYILFIFLDFLFYLDNLAVTVMGKMRSV